MGLLGLVLAGGLSSRMGEDKANLKWGNTSLLKLATDRMIHVCSEVFVSCRKNQKLEIPALVHPIYDVDSNIGPAAGLLGAHEVAPKADWLILACDFPLVIEEGIRELLVHRQAGITCFSHLDGTPEPLFAVWDSGSLEKLKENVKKGLAGPMYTLKNSKHTLLIPSDPKWLVNTNTPDEWNRLIIRHQKA